MNSAKQRNTSKYARPKFDCIDIDGRTVLFRSRINARARRLILRVDAPTGEAIITLPPGINHDTVLEFVRERKGWIAEQLKQSPPFVPFQDGVTIPLMGVEKIICHSPGQRRPVIEEEGVLRVGGGAEYLSRRLKDWLKQQARQEIELRVVKMTKEIGCKYSRISIRDTRSRWGSCSSKGALSFSWRLILAPAWILDYVVAHEVAHLKEHNHSPAFWHVLGCLYGDEKDARDWLSKNGAGLHCFG